VTTVLRTALGVVPSELIGAISVARDDPRRGEWVACTATSSGRVTRV